MGVSSSKSTLLKHQQSYESMSENERPKLYYHRRSPSNTTTSSSQRSLATKFHQKHSSNKLLEGSSDGVERTSPSASSCGSKPKGLLGKITKKKKQPKHRYEGNLSTSVSSLGSFQTCSTFEEDDAAAMTATEAAASALLARYDHEKDTFLSQTSSCAPCIVSQNPGLRLSALKLDCSDAHASTGHSCDTAYPSSTTTTAPVIPFDANMYRVDCDKYTKEWLAASKYNSIHNGLSSQEVLMDLYLKPSNEVDRRKEKDRQQRLHYLLKRIWKSIYRAPLQNPSLIVNWCCGIGVWDMEMAARFPEAKIVGVDFKEATLSNLQHGFPNLEFKFTVIHDTTTGLELFEDNSVDMIMMRDTWLINSPSFKWSNILKEAFRILKPGGYIEIEEQAMGNASKGPNISKLFDWFGMFYEKFQVERSIAIKLTDYLERIGYEKIDEQAITIPLGEWASTPDLKETGFLYKDLVERRLRGLSKWICELNNISMDELNYVITQVMEVEIDKYHSCIDWLSFTARKPKNTQCNIPIKKEQPTTSVLPTPPPPSTQTTSRAAAPGH